MRGGAQLPGKECVSWSKVDPLQAGPRGLGQEVPCVRSKDSTIYQRKQDTLRDLGSEEQSGWLHVGWMEELSLPRGICLVAVIAMSKRLREALLLLSPVIL